MSELRYLDGEKTYYFKRIIYPILQVLLFLLMCKMMTGNIVRDFVLACLGVFIIGFIETRTVIVDHIKESDNFDRFAVYVGFYHLQTRFLSGIISGLKPRKEKEENNDSK